ncbi:DNA translocase FtsK 4TM domain-containing protein, partial [Litorivivens sp.]|uniref:DNA translocase FtsK 4TM domain-containing protein n=1 Tax=Litorivivens sp. TaxID=2020868 RepID=UPI003564FF74
MKNSAQRRDGETREQLSTRLREGALIALAAISLFLFLALASYSADDPGWSRTGTGSDIDNAVGPVGAWVADVFYALFGYMAYLFPLMLAFQAWRVFRDRFSAAGVDPVILGLRLVGFL